MIASIASAATDDKVDLLAIVASAELPLSYEAASSKTGRRINMVVCDASDASVPVTCFGPEEGELPSFSPGAPLAITNARGASCRVVQW
ncbi:hypothetical protein OAO87_04235 [bacterium]|nr:hypothetical protein [bacterium]